MSKLEITIKLKLSDVAHKVDKDGVEEIYLRAAAWKAKEIIEVIGRGNFEVQTTYHRPTKKRRPSKRKPKSKGVSNER